MIIANCNSPRPETLKVSGFLRIFDANRHVIQNFARQTVAQMAARHVFALASGERRNVGGEVHRNRRLVNGEWLERDGVFQIGDGFADQRVFDARQRHDVARASFLDVDLSQTFKAEQIADTKLLERAVQTRQIDLGVRLDFTSDDAPDAQAPDEIIISEVGNHHLQGRFHVGARRGHLLDNHVEERFQAVRFVGQISFGDAVAPDRVNHGKVELVFVSVKINEQIVNLVQHRFGARVLTVDFIDHDNRRQLRFERFAQHESRLGQAAFGGVHQKQTAVGHA